MSLLGSFLAHAQDGIYNEALFSTNYGFSNYNQSIFPSHGYSYHLGLDATLPIGPDSKRLEYFKISGSYQQYASIANQVVRFKTGLGLGASYDSATSDELPYFKRYLLEALVA